MNIHVNVRREEKVKLVDIQQRVCPLVLASEKWTSDDLFQIANKTERYKAQDVLWASFDSE
jgi:hypothetical protein